MGGWEMLLGGFFTTWCEPEDWFWPFKPFQSNGALSGLRQYLASKSFLKMMQNAYFLSEALFVLKIFKFMSWVFGHAAKWLDKKNASFKLYDVTAWLTNN